MIRILKNALRLALAILLFLPSACSDRSDPSAATSSTTSPQVKVSDVQVSDGDTVNIKGERIRLLGIDAPEMASPERFRGDQEPDSSKARDYLMKLLSGVKELKIERSKRPDQYGRTLGYLIGDGKNLNAEMVRGGHAWETISFYGKNGMPERAAEVTAAWQEVKEPKFEKPNIWRKKNGK